MAMLQRGEEDQGWIWVRVEDRSTLRPHIQPFVSHCGASLECMRELPQNPTNSTICGTTNHCSDVCRPPPHPSPSRCAGVYIHRKCKGSLTGGWADAKRRGVSSELSMSGRYPLAGGVGCGAMREEKHKAKFDSTGRSRLTRRLGWYRCGATGR
ncbi:unnamed protein product [Gadus morhua 'NCC']